MSWANHIRSLEDSSGSEESDDFESDLQSNFPAGTFITFFFILWNAMIGSFVVRAFEKLLVYRGCNEETQVLFCPHWLVGIFVPPVIGYFDAGVAGLLYMLIVPVTIPYSIHICLRNRNHGDNGQRVVMGNGRTQVETERRLPPSSEDIEKKILCKTVIERRDDKGEPSERQQSFRASHPKEDLYIRPAEEKSSTSLHEDEAGTPSCTICLETYRDGDCIAYSHNPSCHHNFHKNCLVEWLKRDNDDCCPICREKFLDSAV